MPQCQECFKNRNALFDVYRLRGKIYEIQMMCIRCYLKLRAMSIDKRIEYVKPHTNIEKTIEFFGLPP